MTPDVQQLPIRGLSVKRVDYGHSEVYWFICPKN